MTGYNRQLISLAVALAALAGFVDALGFITLGGFFVSFMSGNSTRISVDSAQGLWPHVGTAALLLILFVAGVCLGTVISHLAGDRRRRKFTVLAAVSTLLLIGSVAATLDWTPVAIGAMVLAMGAENSVFARDGEVTIGVTYMTGALVKMGQRLVGAFLGGPRWAWTQYFALWAGLVVGAVCGALVHRLFELEALWIAASVACALTVAVRFVPYRA